MVRHFLGQEDLQSGEILEIFDRAKSMKPARVSDEMRGRSLVMFFEKSSTRTRLSFEIGMTQMGGHAVYLDRESSQLSRGESVEDTARVVSRYADLLMARVFAHDTVARLAEYSCVPVINGLSDLEHPCQSMADFMTVWERFGALDGVKFAYVGDGNNNVTHSLLLAAAMLGAPISVGAPPSLMPDEGVVSRARELARGGADIVITSDAEEAVQGAQVVYTDVWVSMGREAESADRRAMLQPYQVNTDLFSCAASDAIFMHCLPAHIGEEVSADVAYGPRSVIFDEAENRLHVQKAIMLFLLESH